MKVRNLEGPESMLGVNIDIQDVRDWEAQHYQLYSLGSG